MSNWKNNILFILGIGIAGHQVCVELEKLTGYTTDTRIIAIINDSNNLLQQGIYHIEEGDKYLNKLMLGPEQESNREQDRLLYPALNEYRLGKFAIERAINELETVRATAGPVNEKTDQDIKYLKQIIIKVEETISDIEIALKSDNPTFRIRWNVNLDSLKK